SLIHGSIMPAAPNPNTRYASSAVIAVWFDAFGTAITYACTGPFVSVTVLGGACVVHALLNSAEFAMSGTTPAGTSHVRFAVAGVQLGSCAVDATYCIDVFAAIAT